MARIFRDVFRDVWERIPNLPPSRGVWKSREALRDVLSVESHGRQGFLLSADMGRLFIMSRALDWALGKSPPSRKPREPPVPTRALGFDLQGEWQGAGHTAVTWGQMQCPPSPRLLPLGMSCSKESMKSREGSRSAFSSKVLFLSSTGSLKWK